MIDIEFNCDLHTSAVGVSFDVPILTRSIGMKRRHHPVDAAERAEYIKRDFAIRVGITDEPYTDHLRF